MPDGDSILEAVEYYHYNTNCKLLYDNMRKMLSSKTVNDKFLISKTYGIPYTDLEHCKNYNPINDLIKKKGISFEVKRIVDSSYNLSYEHNSNKYIVS